MDFLNAVENEKRRTDALELNRIMTEITGDEPAMWGPNIVGFGIYSYTYASGHSGDWPMVAFSPRKQALTLYLMSGFARYDELLAKLGKHKTSKACLYINKLEDVNMNVLWELIVASVEFMRPRV